MWVDGQGRMRKALPGGTLLHPLFLDQRSLFSERWIQNNAHDENEWGRGTLVWICRQSSKWFHHFYRDNVFVKKSHWFLNFVFFKYGDKSLDRQSITNKNDLETSTATTRAPTTPSTSESTSNTPKTEIYFKFTTDSNYETKRMTDNIGLVNWGYSCKFIMRTIIRSHFSGHSKEHCARSCLDYSTCAYFNWDSKSFCCSLKEIFIKKWNYQTFSIFFSNSKTIYLLSNCLWWRAGD